MKVFRRFFTYFGIGKYLLFWLSIAINIEYIFFGKIFKCQSHQSSTNYQFRSKRVERCLANRELESTLEDYVRDLIAFKLSFSSDVDTVVIDKHFRKIQRIRENIFPPKSSPTVDRNRNKMVVKAAHHRKQMDNVSKTVFKNTRKHSFVYSCPEKYLGTLHGYPFYRNGFVHKQPCSHLPTNISTSLILDRPRLAIDGMLENSTSISIKETLRFVAGLFKEVNIIVNAKYLGNLKRLASAWPNIFVHVFHHTTPEVSELLNSVSSQKLKTKFVVFAPFVSVMNSQFDLNRMLQVYELTGANFIASSLKDSRTGVWDAGCYQTSLKLYTLKYERGYKRSQLSCVECDFVNGAFLTRTYWFQKGNIRFRSESGSMMYEDLFLNLGVSKNKTILACPDSMVYRHQGNDKKYGDIRDLEKFAKLWDVYTIKWHSNTIPAENFIFPCPHSHKELIRTCRVGKGLAVPPCCLRLLYNGLKFVSRLFERHKLQYILIEGSALGALKFNYLLPWEQDADIAISSNDFSLLETMKLEFEKNNFTLVIDEAVKCCRPPPSKANQLYGGIAHVRVFHWSIQIFGFDSLVDFALNNDTFAPPLTRIKLNSPDISDYDSIGKGKSKEGFFAYVPENPARYSRNRYGYEVFKHAEHWMMAGRKNGWANYESGNFEECSKPAHHACLDQFEADGNLI